MNRNYMKQAVFLLSGMVFLYGCLVGPKYRKPDTQPPQAFVNENKFVNTADSIHNLKWFQLFGDTVLVNLIDTALANNYDLRIAIARIEQAEAIYGFVKADQFPAFSISGNASRTDYSDVPNATSPINDFSAQANVFWEVDLWGKVRHAKRAAFNDYLATIEARKAVQATLISDVANLYFQLRDLDNKIAISERTADSRRESYRILSEQFKEGYVAELDVFQVEQLLRDAEASIPSFKRQRAVVEHSINILLGQNTSMVARGYENTNQPQPPVIPSGLPSTLLTQRPDVMFAEYSYMAENERIGVAIAQRFPTISLTGFLGLASPDISKMITADAMIWEAAGGIFAPVLNFGKNKRRVEAQRKAAEIAMYEYRKSYIIALAEVEDALVACENLEQESEARSLQAAAAEKALTLSQARYDNGYTSYLEVLDAQRSLFSSELLASSIQQQRLSAFVQLYKALGGGW
jgi:multidrug efflux system outer membrane protein